MPLYECVLIARNDVTQQQVDAIADQIGTQLEAEGGSVKKREYWGLRSLAYRIKKNRKGHYMLLGLDAGPAFITEMERKLGLNEDVLRYMTIRVRTSRRPPRQSCRASRTTATAPSVVRGRPAGSTAGAAAATTIARNSAPAKELLQGFARAPRSKIHVRHHRRQSRRSPRRRRRPPAILSAPQVLPVLRPQRAEDRL